MMLCKCVLTDSNTLLIMEQMPCNATHTETSVQSGRRNIHD